MEHARCHTSAEGGSRDKSLTANGPCRALSGLSSRRRRDFEDAAPPLFRRISGTTGHAQHNHIEEVAQVVADEGALTTQGFDRPAQLAAHFRDSLTALGGRPFERSQPNGYARCFLRPVDRVSYEETSSPDRRHACQAPAPKDIDRLLAPIALYPDDWTTRANRRSGLSLPTQGGLEA